MAVVEIYQARETPQARVTMPSGENPLAEQFGGALSELGDTAGRVAGQIAEADRIEDEKAWKQLQPEIAKDLAQSGLDWTAAYADMKENAPADLAGFQDQVKAWGDKRRDELLKKYPGQKAADAIELHFAELMRQYGSAAIVDSTDAKYKSVGNSMQAALDKTANNVALNPKQYNLGRQSMLDMVEAANVSQSFKDDWRAKIDHGLARALFVGRLSDNDATAARTMIDSGIYNDRLSSEDLLDLRQQIDATVKASDARKTQMTTENQRAEQARWSVTFSDALTTARAKGTQTLISDSIIRRIWGGSPEGDVTAEQMIRKLHAEEKKGQLQPLVDSNTPAQNQALGDTLDPNKKPNFSADDAETYQIFSGLLNQKEAAFAGDDPAGAALKYGPDVANAWSEFQQDLMNKTKFRTATALTVIEQERQGVPKDRQQLMPKEIASWVADQIKKQPDNSARLQTLLDFANLGDEQYSRDVVAQLGEYLPLGYKFVVDIADPLHAGNSGDKVLAEKVLAELTVDTGGVELTQETENAIRVGLLDVLSTPARLTDDLDAATRQRHASLTRAAIQIAKAKLLARTTTTEGKDTSIEAAAGHEAVDELLSQYRTLGDPDLARIIYPKAIETRSPGAIAAGLSAFRDEIAADELKARAGVGSESKGPGYRNISDAETAIWINHRTGFVLVRPSKKIYDTDRKSAAQFLKFVTIEETEQRGLRALMEKERQDEEWSKQLEQPNPGQGSELDPF